MYLFNNQYYNLLLKKINLIRAEKCVMGYYPTTLLNKAFNSGSLKVVTTQLNQRVLPTYYRVLPLLGNYPKNSFKIHVINRLYKI